MSDIDVHEIKLDLRYPNSRQEDITDAFMRGYQGAVKIGNDAVRRVKAEKDALERRIDELCQENERLRADQVHWELGNCPSCPNIADLQEALEQNAQLRELVRDMWLKLDGATLHYNASEWKPRLSELGIEVTS